MSSLEITIVRREHLSILKNLRKSPCGEIQNVYSRLQLVNITYLLVTKFIEFTEKEGNVYPFHHLALFSLNFIITAVFGKRFESVRDLDFIELNAMIEQITKYLGLENNLPNFLPVFSLYNFIFEQRGFIERKRDPLIRKLVQDTSMAEGPNVIRSLKNIRTLSDDDSLAITCTYE
ncbi:hypothetical protein BD770DRAFT_458853 [Pilaira anomala]|nr:hypothetical protein BD770DRAFT_458853 [Pilaira anomala]